VLKVHTASIFKVVVGSGMTEKCRHAFISRVTIVIQIGYLTVKWAGWFLNFRIWFVKNMDVIR